jgi:hypothetical protein
MRMIWKFVLWLLAVAAAAYLIDLGILGARIALKASPYDQVTVRSYLAIQEKGNRREYVFQGEQQEQCTRTLFPHVGDQPCWYLRRHADQMTVI